MLKFNYLSLPEKIVPDKEDFYKSGIPEASKIRNLSNICQRLFITTSKNIELFILGDNVYKFDIYSSGVTKYLVARLYYIPSEFRLDLYDGYDLDYPIYAWKSKKLVISNTPKILSIVKADSIFLPLISIL